MLAEPALTDQQLGATRIERDLPHMGRRTKHVSLILLSFRGVPHGRDIRQRVLQTR